MSAVLSGQRWGRDNVGSQLVSCDANGGKYTLDEAVFKCTDVTSANAGLLPNSSQWAVNKPALTNQAAVPDQQDLPIDAGSVH
jgi:hypothetical protein